VLTYISSRIKGDEILTSSKTKVEKQTNTHAKQSSKNKDNTVGRVAKLVKPSNAIHSLQLVRVARMTYDANI
jgi:hypothetical protein